MKMFGCHCTFVGVWVGGSVLDLLVTAEKIKIYPYLYIGKKSISTGFFLRGWSISECLYSRIYLIWHRQEWRGAR
jgi:hypothetical protein